MRISDWSSDVSSSDLCDQLILESKVAAMVDEAAGRGNGRDRRHDDVLQVAKAPGDSRQDGRRPAQVGEQRRPALHAKARLVGRARIAADGKSVAQGRGGSVRVDLGGRRTSKKTTQKK